MSTILLERRIVIARLWRGWTSADDAETYGAYVQATGIADYQRTPGNLGAWMLRRREGDSVEFLTLSFWDSEDAIRGFAGEDIGKAVFYPEDDRYLVDREERVQHYEVHGS
jgi:heme-degrading monooxygenase HmoA